MIMIRIGTPIVALMMLSACTPRIDNALEVEALIQADLDFARATADRGVDGWVDAFADEAVMFRSGGLVVGVDSIRHLMAPAFADSTFRLMWEPVEAHVATAGDLGYTIGRYERMRALTDGTSDVATGSYVTIWRKQADGAWKAVLDIGTPDVPPAGG
jgi:ketosteroid isomerase-like protein